MCRWLAYSGSPVLLEDLLYKPQNSLVVQSLHSQLGAETDERRRVRRRVVRRPADARACSAAPSRPGTTATSASWPRHDQLAPGASRTSAPPPGRRCSRRTATRSGTGAGCGCTTATSAASPRCKRDLSLAIDPALFPEIEGTTDTELLFHLALTYGLEDDPPAAMARAVGLVEDDRPAARRGVPDPDDRGDHRRRHHVGVPLLERGPVAVAVPQHRRRRRCATSTRTTRCCTTSPTTPGWSSPSRWATCSGAWNEMPEATCVVVHGGRRSCCRSPRQAPAPGGLTARPLTLLRVRSAHRVRGTLPAFSSGQQTVGRGTSHDR